MTASSDDDLQALESARSRLAARLQASGSMLPAVIRPANPRAAAMDAMLRAAVEKIDEALTLLRHAPPDAVQTAAPDAAAETFRTVLRAKSTSSLSSLIPTLQPVEARDDLTVIDGINDAIARQLAAIGVTRLRQIADWNADDVRHITHALGLHDAITQQHWIAQARAHAELSPVTIRLTPVPQSAPSASDRHQTSGQRAGQATNGYSTSAGNAEAGGSALTVAGIGLDDILASIRSTPPSPPEQFKPGPIIPEPFKSEPFKPESGKREPRVAQWGADPVESTYGVVHPLPVTPDAPAVKTSANAEDDAPPPVPVHEDAASRLAQLEAELQSLAKTYPSTQPAQRAAVTADDTVILAPPTLRDRLGGLPPATAPQDVTLDVEEAEVMIVTTAARSRAKPEATGALVQARTAPPGPPSLALVPAPPVTLSVTAPVMSSQLPDSRIDVDEATVVIVRQPKAAQLMPELPFFQAAKQPVEERAVQRFLKALHGE